MRQRGSSGSTAARTLIRVEMLLETPMVVLGAAWLSLTVVELACGPRPWLSVLMDAIWLAFIADFGLKMWLAPRKARYAAKNWLTLLSLALPALRVLRVARAIRLLRLSRSARGLRLVRLFASMNRGMGALNAALSRRGFGYAVILTSGVTAAGAGAMLAFERPGLRDYPEALWWTAMLMTTMGTDFWPKTPEGRLLCFLLALYAFAVFGYITAAIATFFIGADARLLGQGRGKPSEREI